MAIIHIIKDNRKGKRSSTSRFWEAYDQEGNFIKDFVNLEMAKSYFREKGSILRQGVHEEAPGNVMILSNQKFNFLSIYWGEVNDE